ncbi:hypothetical protein MPH_01969 [Macrophomina phaseolina MS6]|uniref:Uncharacterized protein n=1 Tax=Macrophomina phaseolina (strain MS6) TaxID=1126212 RepID=K2SVS3_MACPH|nr:hypothetical protein MPH_01969 [Macrophomina phaseolina MS6]
MREDLLTPLPPTPQIARPAMLGAPPQRAEPASKIMMQVMKTYLALNCPYAWPLCRCQGSEDLRGLQQGKDYQERTVAAAPRKKSDTIPWQLFDRVKFSHEGGLDIGDNCPVQPLRLISPLTGVQRSLCTTLTQRKITDINERTTSAHFKP